MIKPVHQIRTSKAFMKMQEKDAMSFTAIKEKYNETPENGKVRSFSFTKNWYATLVVLLILAIKIVNQWIRKTLTYSFGFSVPEGFPVELISQFEIGASYP